MVAAFVAGLFELGVIGPVVVAVELVQWGSSGHGGFAATIAVGAVGVGDFDKPRGIESLVALHEVAVAHILAALLGRVVLLKAALGIAVVEKVVLLNSLPIAVPGFGMCHVGEYDKPFFRCHCCLLLWCAVGGKGGGRG